MRNPSKFIKSYVNKFKVFELTPLEREKFVELIRVLSNANTYDLKPSTLPEGISEKRFAICKACEHITIDKKEYGDSDPHCTLCNCNLNKKVQRVYEQCPMRKWVNNDISLMNDIDQALEIINNLIQDENWVNLLSVEEQFEVNYQEAIKKLEQDASTELVDKLIEQSQEQEIKGNE